MTATAISNSLSLPQIQDSTRQQAVSAINNFDPGQSVDAAGSGGQNLPTTSAPANAALMEGASTAVLSPNITALLLQMQET